jgi:hypothetical protein
MSWTLNTKGACNKLALVHCARGDPSSEFRFATFFPDAVQPWADDMVAKFVQVIPLGGEAVGRPPAGYPKAAAILPGSETSDATRRR